MHPGRRRQLTIGTASLLLVVGAVGVLGESTRDPLVLVETPSVRAAGSFLLLLLFGTGVLYRYDGLADRSLDATLERPALSIVYGVMAHLMVWFAAVSFLSQVSRVGVGQRAASLAIVAAVGLVFLTLGALGFLVVGTWLTALRGERRPWNGLVVGAAIAALGLLVLPPVGGAVVWSVVVSVGIGGLVRTWVHDERTGEDDTDG
jgi:O-antigen ligase